MFTECSSLCGAATRVHALILCFVMPFNMHEGTMLKQERSRDLSVHDQHTRLAEFGTHSLTQLRHDALLRNEANLAIRDGHVR